MSTPMNPNLMLDLAAVERQEQERSARERAQTSQALRTRVRSARRSA